MPPALLQLARRGAGAGGGHGAGAHVLPAAGRWWAHFSPLALLCEMQGSVPCRALPHLTPPPTMGVYQQQLDSASSCMPADAWPGAARRGLHPGVPLWRQRAAAGAGAQDARRRHPGRAGGLQGAAAGGRGREPAHLRGGQEEAAAQVRAPQAAHAHRHPGHQRRAHLRRRPPGEQYPKSSTVQRCAASSAHITRR